jgi:DNA invertase Pin-like site-specific DNA recombinase
MNYPQTTVCLFARTSSEGNKADRQDFDRQINELKEYCHNRNWHVSKIIASKVSGSKTGLKRQDIKDLFESAKKGQFSKVVICETSRLGRVAKDIRNTIDSLHALKIPVVFKNLGGMESLDDNGNETFVTNIIISIYAELAQEEKRILSERVKSGLREAIRKGKIIGRRKGSIKDTGKLLKEYSRLAKDIQMGLSLQKCMKIHTLSKNTIIKVKKALYETNDTTTIRTAS